MCCQDDELSGQNLEALAWDPTRPPLDQGRASFGATHLGTWALCSPPPERPQETYPAPQPCTMHRPNRSLGPHRFVEPCWARLDDIPRCSAVAIRGRSASCWVCSTGAPLQWEALASGGFGCAPHVLRQGG